MLDLAPTEPPGPEGAKPKPNLRTCGRSSGERGAPYRAKVTRAESVPTIPSRYETQVFKGYREVLGFGSHALRWQEKPEGGRVGPGYYNQQKTFYETTGEKTGWGIRGTGSFASHTARLGARSVPAMPVAGRGVPGPGKYEEMPALQQMKNGKDFNRAAITAVFAKPVDKFIAHPMPKTEPQPGPGHYDQNGKRIYNQEPSAASVAFRSRCDRVGQGRPPAAENPGPGEYADTARAAFPISEGASSSTEAKQPNAIFKIPSRPRILRIHPDLPTADRGGREALGKLADEVGRECQGTTSLATKQPGPGAYDVNRDEILESGFASANVNGSSSFLPGSKRTEWADSEVQRKPGPGKYDPNRSYVAPEKFTSAKSAFASLTDRGKYEVTPSPGPAFYKPEQQKVHKSFRMKSADLWVA
eukprot:TRINITY_DN61318_c0_g1_i1.p1 TRINITY_DN61318_c0_g1~~TRINITY_DN61318_c0_g1_i1.p1  ORF type:complete len:444 (+),score=58.00 TRINITY_DN61318_c0_g1_i1:86-1333(+)